ncbi:MAG: hypothetical protein A2169_12405 [Deltaproteobacteria bacterium RBG_13_47_9]|nr:MAG: hypothetical protein A2169_12405 [Deltaproteobacteria bacterium RBG_13_47_9]
MKRTAAKSTTEMLQKIENIEKEVMGLKLTLLKNLTPSGKKLISLKGILKGVEITEEDISFAKKSLYGKIGA